MAQINTVFFQEAPTKLQGANFALGQGEKRTFRGAPLGRHRKKIIISNDDNGSTRLYVSIGDPESASASGRARVAVVFAQGTLPLETNDDITLFNPSTTQAVTAIHVVEMFYTGAGALVI